MNAQPMSMARSIPRSNSNSSMADLESTTTSAAATAVRTAHPRTGASTNFSGQYLYDRFVSNDQTEVTKLGIVRQMVDALDIAAFKKVIGDFVAVAKAQVDSNIKAAQDSGTYDEQNPGMAINQAQARFKTAQNHQTVMRLAYGAIKFAPDHLAQAGYNDKTGYQTMRVIAKKALENAGLKWDGQKLASKDDAEKARETRLEQAALNKVMGDNPRGSDEPMAQYLERCANLVDQQVVAAKSEAAEKHRANVVKKIVELAGEELDDIIMQLLDLQQQRPLEAEAAV